MPLPANFAQNAALLQQGALAYCTAARQAAPTAKAEDIIPGLVAWLEAQTTPDGAVLAVVGVHEQSVVTAVFDPHSNPLVKTAADNVDNFLFQVQSTFPDTTVAVTGVAIPRSSIGG